MARFGITGGGFIGTALARRLRADGHEVRGVDVTDTAAPSWAAFGASLVTGDVTDPDAMATFAAGLDVVVHTAAVVQESGDLAWFRRINVEGARTVAAAAKGAGVRSFVHFSSVMVYGFDYPDGVTEAGPFDGGGNPYAITKIESEAAVLDLHEPGVFDVRIVRPGDVYGPGSVPWTIRPVELLQSGLFAYLDGGTAVHNHVYIDNLVDGVLLVLESGTPGEAYVITDDARTTVREFFGHYADLLGITDVPSVSADEARAFGIDPEAIRYLLRPGVYSCEKIKALGYHPAVSLDAGMAATLAWLVATGLVPAGD